MSQPEFDGSHVDLEGKSILITGGTGSFGKQMLKQLLASHNPKRVSIFARGEYNHFLLQNSLTEEQRHKVRFFVGDVRDLDRMVMAMRGIDIVIHAAAQKQVPLAEYNPFECIRTNVIGAENVVQAAIRAGVSKVLALSTDKAVNPINLYGASKLASDKIFVAANSLAAGTGTSFSVVRYGNVLGSRGSVIPFFRKLLKEGATELPVTDERMTRFWITLEQAVAFTITCIGSMRGGEIYVPKIPSMRITDLVEALAPGIATSIVGIRPGEKLHELMITDHNAPTTLDMGDRYVIEPEWNFWSRPAHESDGHPTVPEGFEYTSDNNDWWMSVDELRETLEHIPLEGE
ncbi:MAG: UDP-N-acetylglucosamine 4,6-dehydratase (inverting) [Kordiimonadaceae bacterium]|nr:UDP-N-acetylglucosamine 4,6-dehydratase (inverting) [Kordiimonadaceae bacterium]MBO6570668.1 UDP-N-acetylglucosamine 4,6-dehydratase (inverting) [Kordiimonadaceae bacterium]MBO6966474.1 UDP-N-acetylglucosamine 4,6-dehydratase (inverting) [Kordiimonadaceae bacterium]